MLRVDTVDVLKFIAGIIMVFAGLILNFIVKRRQQQVHQQTSQPNREQQYDDFEDEGSEPPQTFESLVKRMMQTDETHTHEEDISFPNEAQSLEVIPEMPSRNYYHPVINRQTEKDLFPPVMIEEDEEATDRYYEFDIRQAVIANEILNRRY